MKRFIEGLDRSQTTLLPDCIDDYVDEVNSVRAIDAFIETLNLAALGFDIEPEATGRPGYHPETMLKLYVYVELARRAPISQYRLSGANQTLPLRGPLS